MIKKVILLLFVLCALAFPANAAIWEQTFEGHPDDLDMSYFDLGKFRVTYETMTHDHDCKYDCISAGEVAYIDADVPFTGCLSFDAYAESGSGAYTYFEVIGYDDSKNVIFSCNYSYIGGNSYSAYAIVEREDGSGVQYYQGIQSSGLNYVGSVNYTDPDALVSSIRFKYTAGVSGCTMSLDDITPSEDQVVILTDSGKEASESYQYFGANGHLPSTGHYRLRVYSPSNAVVFNQDLSTYDLGSCKFYLSKGVLTEVGDYKIFLYHDISETSSVYIDSKTFNVYEGLEDSAGSIELDKTDYYPGESINVYAHVNTYDDGYYICTRYTDDGEYDIVDITSVDTFVNLEVDLGAGASYNRAVSLVGPDGSIVDVAYYNIVSRGQAYVSFDKSVYTRNETAYITYSGVDTYSDVNLMVTSDGRSVGSTTYACNSSGSGVVSVDLSSLEAGDGLVVTLLDYNHIAFMDTAGNAVSDTARILSGDYYLKGRVYDSITGAAINDAAVFVGAYSTTTDVAGNYGIRAPAGDNGYGVTKDGYNQLFGTVAVYKSITNRNFYLTPISADAGYGIYGTVTSAKTADVIPGARVEVTSKDNGVTYSAWCNKNGFFSIMHDDLAGNITVKVSATNYDNFYGTYFLEDYEYYGWTLVAIEDFDETEYDDEGGSDGAEDREYKEKYGELGRHPFDFNGDGTVSNSEWRYVIERIIVVIGCLGFIGFLNILNKRR